MRQLRRFLQACSDYDLLGQEAQAGVRALSGDDGAEGHVIASSRLDPGTLRLQKIAKFKR